jgi:hypothetical protein
MSTNLGSITAGNIILANQKGSISFLNALSTTPQVGVLTNIFDSTFDVGSNADRFDTVVTGTASVYRDSTLNCIVIKTPANNDGAIFQQKNYVKTSSSSSRVVNFVANLDASASIVANNNITVSAGCFDSSVQKTDSSYGNGFYFKYRQGQFSVVQRLQNTDTEVVQSNFNLDYLDGTGLSKLTLNPASINSFIIVYENSCVNMGIISNGSVIFAHRFTVQANVQSLPIRFELQNTLSTTPTMVPEVRVYSASISSSGPAIKGVNKSIGLRASPRDISTAKSNFPVLSVRLKSNNARASAQLQGLHVHSTVDMYYEIVLNGTLTGASWTSASSALTEYDRTATNITGGTVVSSGYISKQTTMDAKLSDYLPLSSTISGVCDTYTLNVVCLMSSGVIWSSIDVSEIA